jgi:RNA polymerase sigma factor (sigma-70 family)
MSGPPLGFVLRYFRKVLDAPPAEGVPDAELLQRFVSGRDEAAFELLLWRHAALVLHVCQGVLRDSHAAEDAFQATFLALARKAGSLRRRESLAGWLYHVAYRVALKARARVAARRAHEAQARQRRAPASSAEPAADAARRDLAPVLHEELNRLAARYRLPLVLCYLEGKTHAEAARQLGWA